jgi:hypothetical protein
MSSVSIPAPARSRKIKTVSVPDPETVPPVGDANAALVLQLDKVEVIDKGPGRKTIFVPQNVREYLYSHLDIEDIFPDRIFTLELLKDRSAVQTRYLKNLASVTTGKLLSVLDTIKEKAKAQGHGDLTEEGKANFELLVSILDLEAAAIRDKFSNFQSGTSISFDELHSFLNSAGNLISHPSEETKLGLITKSAEVHSSFFGTYLEVKGTMYANSGNGVTAVEHSFYISSYYGTKPLADIGISWLKYDQAAMEEMAARGKKYVELTSKPSYSKHTGNIVRRSWRGDRKYKASGRVMVDYLSMKSMDPNYSDYFGGDGDYHGRGNKALAGMTSFTDEQYAAMSPYVYGFAMNSKVWGEMLVDNISEIAFRDDAYDMLVLEESTKDMVFALVDNSVGGSKDFIDGKGGGCIFLLAGPPGGGKTLTAESVAERLHRPLYMVGVGELGTSAVELESNLRQILEVATSWNAVLLIDECDIFMEERTDNDIERNAMVGVFLRLLEYYEGVLFLTSNRAANIDQAFYSRISLALHYAPLDVDARTTVWENLLRVYGVTEVDVTELAEYELNGRKIKGVIRIAKSLAAAEGREPTLLDFEEVIWKEEEFKLALYPDDEPEDKLPEPRHGFWYSLGCFLDDLFD